MKNIYDIVNSQEKRPLIILFLGIGKTEKIREYLKSFGIKFMKIVINDKTMYIPFLNLIKNYVICCVSYFNACLYTFNCKFNESLCCIQIFYYYSISIL
jgi:hypothetical protein